MQNNRYAFLTASIFLLPGGAFAADFQKVVSLGYDGGNDDLIRVTFVDGDTTAVKANQGLGLMLGSLFYGKNPDWQMQITAGIKYRSVDSSNGGVRFTAFPIELIGFYNTDMVRLGLGATYHINPAVKTSGAVGGNDVELDSTLGYIVQLGFRTGRQGGFSVDFRYTAIEFSGETTRGGFTQPLTDVSGDSAGIYVSTIF